MKNIYLSTLVKNWIVWGIAQFINLKYVPLKVLYQAVNQLPIENNFVLIIAVPHTVCEHGGTVLECMSNPPSTVMTIFISKLTVIAARARV